LLVAEVWNGGVGVMQIGEHDNPVVGQLEIREFEKIKDVAERTM
jgi:hypothetical protein